MIPDAPLPAFPSRPTDAESRGPSLANPYAAWPVAITVVTPDIAASAAYYHRYCGYAPQDRQDAIQLTRTGAPAIHLIAAPHGATPNRDRQAETPVDPGFAALRCRTDDIARTHAALLAEGAAVHCTPHYYAFGPPQRPWTSGMMFAADGPAGERIIFDQPYRADALRQKAPTPAEGEVVQTLTPVIFSFDRWPLLDRFEIALGLHPISDRYAGQEGLSDVVGVPGGVQFRILALGGMEIWEFRAWRPPASPPWPTSLTRTGLAMLTLACTDARGARGRLSASGVTVDPGERGAFTFIGAGGECIEIMDRTG